MTTRTVRFDADADKTLNEIRKVTGQSISEVLKHGLIAYKQQLMKSPNKTPYEIFCELDLGEGGFAIDSAANAKNAIRAHLKRKHES